MVNLKFLFKAQVAKSGDANEKALASTKEESKQETVTQEHTFDWCDFFGIDLTKSPNQEWYELSSDTNPNGETIRNFRTYKGLGAYFTELEAKVIAKSATNFFLRAPYSSKNAFDIYYTIERNIANPGITEKKAAKNFEGQFDSIYDSIHWDLGEFSIIMDRDFDTEEIKLGVWTNLYNAEFLDIEAENETKAIPEHCWDDVCGFDLKRSPNSTWIETAGQVNPSGDKIRNFRCNELKGTFFTELEAKVIGNKATNFFFTAPYSIENAVDIYYNVEKLFAHPSITKKEASNNFGSSVKCIYDNF